MMMMRVAKNCIFFCCCNFRSYDEKKKNKNDKNSLDSMINTIEARISSLMDEETREKI